MHLTVLFLVFGVAAYYQSWHQWSVALIAAIIADFIETEIVHHQVNIKLKKKKRKKGETKDGEKTEKGPTQLTWKQIW